MKNDNSKQILLSVLGVAILVVAVVGISFAAFSYSKTGEKVNTITTGTITMSYSEKTNGINITNALPTSDATGKTLSGENEKFDFSVSATIDGTTSIDYVVTAKPDTTTANTLPETALKVYLTDGASSSEAELLAPKILSTITKTQANDQAGAPEGEFVLYRDTFSGAGGTKNFRLRMWVDENYAGAGGETGIVSETYKLRVNVYGKAAA